MSTTNKSTVTADRLISATVKYSNTSDESRAYSISANVNIRNGAVVSFDNGEVVSLTSAEEGMYMEPLATFSSYGERSLSLNVGNAVGEEARLILQEVQSFMEEVKSSVSTNPITA